MSFVLINTLVPIFAGLALGYIAGRSKMMDSANVQNLIVLTMNFAVPSALFSGIAQATRKQVVQHLPVALILAFLFVALWMATYLWSRRALKLDVSGAAVLALTIGFPNSAAVALPLFQSMYGAESTITAVLSITMGATTVSPLTLAFLEAKKASNNEAVSFSQVLHFFPAAVAKPVVWAPILGIVCAVAGMHLPSFLLNTVRIFSEASTACALILTGVAVSAQSFCWNGSVAWATVLKLLFQPLLALGFLPFFHADRHTIGLIAVVAALPGGFFGLVFGKSYGTTPQVASSGLIATYLCGVVTLPVWLVVINKYF